MLVLLWLGRRQHPSSVFPSTAGIAARGVSNLTLGLAGCSPQSCFSSLCFTAPSLQGTHESLKGNAKALSTVTAIIDGTGSIGAALGPLLAGLISPTGWNNVFYMLIAADVLACLVGSFFSVLDIQGVPCSHPLAGRGQGQSSGDNQARG
uniref:Uncharacterized protein n=1 Tax=Calidris pygmaea TaxID=425635 RepID=A0A8C3J498_9CHAR